MHKYIYNYRLLLLLGLCLMLITSASASVCGLSPSQACENVRETRWINSRFSTVSGFIRQTPPAAVRPPCTAHQLANHNPFTALYTGDGGLHRKSFFYIIVYTNYRFSFFVITEIILRSWSSFSRSALIFLLPCSTVVWSLLPRAWPIEASERSVYLLHRYMQICLG